MCKFYSAIVLRNGDILHNPWTTSHEDLIDEFNINDNMGYLDRFVRIEFYPDDSNDISNVENYSLHIDETEIPDWFLEIQPRILEDMKTIILRMIIKDQNLKILVGKCVILSNSVIDKMIASKCYKMENSSIGEMWGNSSIGEMWGNSNVDEMLENSSVGKMLDNSSIGKMWDNSGVDEMWEYSSVNEMWGNSSVSKMLENSSVGEMLENSKVNVKKF